MEHLDLVRSYSFALVYGLVVGYFASSYFESLLHDVVMHASPRLAKRFKQYQLLWISYFSHHIVHHRLTYRSDYTVQFVSEEERREVDGIIAEKVGVAAGTQIIEEGYGNTVYDLGVLKALSPLFIVGPLAVSFIEFPLALAAAMGFLISASVFVLLNIFLHPLLHTRIDAVDDLNISEFMKWLLLSKYGIFVRKYHYLHHKNEHGNFNLLLGGDILRRKFAFPAAQEEREMLGIGLIRVEHIKG